MPPSKSDVLQPRRGGGDKAEHHVEKFHQDSSRALNVTRNIRRFDDRTNAQMKNKKISSNAAVIEKQQAVKSSTNRNRNKNVPHKSKTRKEEQNQIKKEKRSNYANTDV